jgi:mannose-6-phosphate isomerase-like protein (cupin superfamily)
MRSLVVLAFLAGLPAAAEIQDVLTSARVDAEFAHARLSLEVHKRPNYAILFRVDQNTPREIRRADADEVWLVHKGSAALTLGGREYRLGVGDFVHVARNTPVRVDPGSSRLETIVVQIFPEGADRPPAPGGFLTPRQMPDVVSNAEVNQTLAAHDTNQPLHSGRNFTMNYVIYKGHPGPWEAHRGCVDIYFLRMGKALAQLGGDIVAPKEDTPGEIRGTGVSGSRAYRVGPGDLVVIPRNGAHHMDPGNEKMGYLLVKVWAE